MKFNNFSRGLFLLLSLVFLTGQSVLIAQNGFQLSNSQELKVSGTSTLHDWNMSSEGATGQAVINIEDNVINSIESLRVDLPVKSLQSGNRRMDRVAYDAIDADRHSHVRFVLTNVSNITSNQVQATGNLTIAGVTRPVTLRAGYQINGNTVQFMGAHSIKFSQFDVAPPTALLGAVRTGDNLQLSFDVHFRTESGIN